MDAASASDAGGSAVVVSTPPDRKAEAEEDEETAGATADGIADDVVSKFILEEKQGPNQSDYERTVHTTVADGHRLHELAHGVNVDPDPTKAYTGRDVYRETPVELQCPLLATKKFETRMESMENGAQMKFSPHTKSTLKTYLLKEENVGEFEKVIAKWMDEQPADMEHFEAEMKSAMAGAVPVGNDTWWGNMLAAHAATPILTRIIAIVTAHVVAVRKMAAEWAETQHGVVLPANVIEAAVPVPALKSMVAAPPKILIGLRLTRLIPTVNSVVTLLGDCARVAFQPEQPAETYIPDDAKGVEAGFARAINDSIADNAVLKRRQINERRRRYHEAVDQLCSVARHTIGIATTKVMESLRVHQHRVLKIKEGAVHPDIPVGMEGREAPHAAVAIAAYEDEVEVAAEILREGVRKWSIANGEKASFTEDRIAAIELPPLMKTTDDDATSDGGDVKSNERTARLQDDVNHRALMRARGQSAIPTRRQLDADLYLDVSSDMFKKTNATTQAIHRQRYEEAIRKEKERVARME